MSMLHRALLRLLVLWTVLMAAPAWATIAVPVAPEDLAADADAIVVGRVTRIRSFWHRDEILTRITLAVDEVLKGEVAGPTLRITQTGGTVAGDESWIHGSPEFHRGEQVLVFLTEQPDRTLRVSHLFLGKFSLVPDPATGDVLAVRDPHPSGVHVLSLPGSPTFSADADAVEITDLRQRIARNAERNRPGKRVGLMTRDAVDAAAAQEADSFKFFSTPGRWFEPDTGTPIVVSINSTGEPVAPSRGFDQSRAAMAAWSTVPGSALRLQEGPVTSSGGLVADGVTSISFRDPRNQIGSRPSGCGGILAIGGHFMNGSSKTVNGMSFRRIYEGDLTTNKGWEGCNVWENFSRMAEVLTHELGHVLGYAHSTDSGATMAPRAHFDGRGASLATSDKQGVVFAYPGSGGGGTTFTLSVVRAGTGTGTVTSTPAGISCGTDCSEAFSADTVVGLVATPAAGSVFSHWTGACSGTGACNVAMTAGRSVTANFTVPASVADLVVTTMESPPPTATIGSSFSIRTTVRNTGQGAASASRLRFYLSPSGTHTAADIRAGGVRSIAPLQPGSGSTGRTDVRVRLATSPGTYWLIACADDLAAVTEASETNNCLVSATSVVVTPAAASTGAPPR